MKKLLIVLITYLLITPCVSYATSANQLLKLAVASNFRTAAIEIANIFTSETGNEIIISSASTGKLYAQIINGAPFDIFLAADESTPIHLENKNLTVDGSRFTYAYGRLVLCSLDLKQLINPELYVANFEKFNKIAIANPKLAPYGAAALEVLKNLNLYESAVNKLIYGENINQAFQYVASGSADIGIVAFSQVKSYHTDIVSSYWVIPDNLYKPIPQQAVLLSRAKDSKIAYEFLSFMKGALAKKIMEENYGYYVETGDKSTDLDKNAS